MRIAFHHREGSYSDRWLAYCTEHHLPYEVVNAYDSDIIRRLASADAFLWHWSHGEPRDLLVSRHIIMAAEMMGLAVYPNTATCWHYNDKVAQKYLLEAVGAPLIPTYVFYDLETALAWIDRTSFPKVFKLRRGAGSRNVLLVRTASEARRLAKKAFGRGYKPLGGYLADGRARIAKVRRRGDLWEAIKRQPRCLRDTYRRNLQIGRERGYVYFQDFIQGSAFDTRVSVVGQRAFACTRKVRPNDFRASGSGSEDYDPKRIDPRCLRIAFDVAAKLGAQSISFDFLGGGSECPLIAEVSYAQPWKLGDESEGHWDAGLRRIEGHVWPPDAILEDLLAEVRRKQTAEGCRP